MFESWIEAVANGYADAYAEFADLDLACLDRAQLLDLLRAREEHRRRLEAEDHRLLAEVLHRGIPAECGHPRPAGFLRELLRISPSDASARVWAAETLGPRHGLTGVTLPPLFPLAAAAVAAGVISDRHADVLTRLVDRLPTPVQVAEKNRIEHQLVDLAATLDPVQLTAAARRIEAHLDPDGILATEAEQQRRRCLHLRPRADGGVSLRGELTAECAALFLPAMQTLAAPRPSVAGDPDDRSASQRQHDALTDMAALLLASGKLPPSGGAPATVILHLTEDHLRSGRGLVETGTGQQLTVQAALRIADQALIFPVILDPTGTILGGGTQQRCASTYQRRQLTARDKGCSFPSCDIPAAWTQVHHIQEWRVHGPTHIPNLTLLCGPHHRSFEKRGWRCDMRQGIPWWTPPKHLDSHQTPRRNRYFDTQPVRR